ncbi:MAG: hypothetical protein GY913_29025 [Proteobacteria bacterium]|nr:hypothetical protein [Pseudomonadota bacterium]MCP4920957.1 hypothetical protein [Pseudomonadota bacterium]
MFLFHELHVDDDVLEVRQDRRTYEQARDLIEAILAVPESLGQRMALRVRHHFARAALTFEGPDNALVRWEERGHEIGAHAHRRHIRTTRDALVAAGVRDLRAVVPGLIRCSRSRAARITRACEGLGFSYISDQLQFGSFPYAGRVPWRPARDLSGPGNGPFVFVDVSVNPFAWGLLRQTPTGVEQTFGLRDEHFALLGEQLAAWQELPTTSPLDYFGYPFHEHQHTAGPYTLAPDERSLTAWHDFVAGLSDVQIVLPRELAAKAAPESPRQRAASRLDRRDLRYDLPSWLEDRMPHRAATQERPMGRRGPLRIDRHGPLRPRLAVVVSHAGRKGGTRELLKPWGLWPDDLPDVAFYFWDRGGALHPGEPHHADELVQVFERAQTEGVPVGILTWSAGLIPALRALNRIEPAFLIDSEGPADRLSITPRSDEPDELGHRSRLTDRTVDAWEPWRRIESLACPYHRLQGRLDHMHGRCDTHARILVRATGGTLHTVDGRLGDHPDVVRALLSEV